MSPSRPEFFEQLLARSPLTHEGRLYVQRVRLTAPARMVESGQSMVGRIASWRMRHTIQGESRNIEIPAIYEYERVDGPFEYWDQCEVIRIPWQRPGSTRKYFRTYPDFLVLWLRDKTPPGELEAEFHEWKQEKEMRARANADPARVVPDGTGRWRDKIIDGYTSTRLGIRHLFRTDASLNPTLIANSQFLHKYRRLGLAAALNGSRKVDEHK